MRIPIETERTHLLNKKNFLQILKTLPFKNKGYLSTDLIFAKCTKITLKIKAK